MNVDPKVEQYFKMLDNKKYKDAEDLLVTLKETITTTKKGKGYWQALEGLLLTSKANGDKNLYIPKVKAEKENLEEVKKEFSSHAKNTLHDDYDRGYFQALLDYMTIIFPNK